MSVFKIRKGILPLSIASVFLLSSATPGFAANQGQPGSNAEGGSTGNLDMSVTVPPMTRITDLQDITFTGNDVGAEMALGNGLTGSSTACVRANDPAITYTLTVTSDNPDATTSDFRATNGTAHIPYAVEWVNGSTGTPTSLKSGDTLTGQTPGQQGLNPNTVCTNMDTINVAVSFADLTADAVTADTYTDLITVNVIPE